MQRKSFILCLAQKAIFVIWALMMCNCLIYSSAGLPSLPSLQCSVVARYAVCVRVTVRKGDKVNRSLMPRNKQTKTKKGLILKLYIFPPSCSVHILSTIITLLSLLKDQSIPKHQFHWNIIPLTAVTIDYVSSNAAYNTLMKVTLKWMVCGLSGLDLCGWEGNKRNTNVGN